MKTCTPDLFTWGVDVSTKQIALAIVRADGFTTHTLDVRGKPNSTERLSNAYAGIRDWVREVAQDWPPMVVFVERPTGSMAANPNLVDMVGVTQLAIHDGLAGLSDFPVLITTIAVAKWKKHGVGHGNASKDQVRDWAMARGISPDASGDECDALGIAIGGAVLTSSLSAETSAAIEAPVRR